MPCPAVITQSLNGGITITEDFKLQRGAAYMYEYPTAVVRLTATQKRIGKGIQPRTPDRICAGKVANVKRSRVFSLENEL